MDQLLPILAALLIFCTVFFLLLAFASGTAGQAGTLARQRLDAVTRGVPEPESQAGRAGAGSRLVGPLFGGLVKIAGNLLPKSLLAGVERKLVIAGEPMTMNGFLTMLVIATSGATGLGLMVIVAMGSGIGLVQIGILGGLGLIGFYLPFHIVTSRARQRQHAIIKSLADAFDLITTCVEAGLGLDAALSRVAEKVEGPFAQELSRSLRDIALGKARKDALKELGERTQVPDLIQFTNAVVQAETMGSSVGTVLRVQSDQLRVKRRQRAEEQAYKAPVKMLFPLVLFVFPTLFIVILGPAIITIMQGFPK
jgi:tight adherence protein C